MYSLRSQHRNTSPWGRRLRSVAVLVVLVLAWCGLHTGAVYGQANVQIVHNSGDPAAKVVDIYIENDAGTLVQTLDDVAYRDATGFLELSQDTYEITVAQPTSTGPDDAVVQTFPGNALTDGTNYTVIANGVVNTGDFTANPDMEDIAFDLDIATGARETVDSQDGDVEVRVAHGVTDAPTVDVQDGTGTTLVDNASYTGITGYINAPAGPLTLNVTDEPGTSTLFSFDTDLGALADTPLTVIASGFASPDDESASPLAPFTLLAVAPTGDVIDLGAARAQIVHNSGDPAATSVDVYIDGTRVLDDFEYRSATPFIDLDSGVREIAVAPSTSTDASSAIAEFTSVVPTNGSLTILANGVVNTGDFTSNPDGNDIGFNLDIATGARESVESTDGDVEIRAAHGVTDAPTVDVLAGGSVFVDDAAYTDITGYLGAPAGQVTLEVTPGNDNSTVLYEYEQDLSGFSDTPLTVIASGFNTPDDESVSPLAPFTLIAVAPSGTVVNLGSDLVVNEFLADPNGAVDANNDGTADAGDQFVELVNVSTTNAIDVSEYTIATSNGTYTVPNQSGTTLDPGKGLVVFNGGSPTGFGVFAGTGLPEINSGGDEIVVSDATGAPLQTIRFGGGPPAPTSKATLDTGLPQQAGTSTALDGTTSGTGTYVLHTNISGNSVAHSAGQNNVTGATLPVEMADFSATLDESAAVLTWRTLSEENNSGFEVQHRAPEASAFETVGFREGQGTTTEETAYRFRVADLATGRHEFRLKQVDLDGSSTLTDVVTVDLALDGAFTWSKMAPNPVSSTGTLSIQVRETQDVTVRLFDVLGRRVQTFHNGPLSSGSRHQITVDGDGLSNGTYVLRIQGESFSGNQQITVVK